MSLKAFYAAILSALATVIALSLAWEFWLEDWLMPFLVDYHEAETRLKRWEFVATTAFFSAIALAGPTLIGTRLIRRDRSLHQRMVRLSQEDHLTGLFNRRRITELLENEVQRATRYQTTFSVILMDIDNFKAINDGFGHPAGDRVLVSIADIIRSRLRTTDLVGRWGGEEFVIASPETDIQGGLSLAEEIRTRLESADLGEVGRKTASFGVTAFVAGDDIEAVIARADAGLYAAKRGGKNLIGQGPVGDSARFGRSVTAG